MEYTEAKDPDAVLDYTIDWDDNVLVTGETISTSTWTVPTGITKDSDTKTNGTATITLSGGTAGEEYILTNKIVTSASRTYEKSIIVPVLQQ